MRVFGAIPEDLPSNKNLIPIAAAQQTETIFRQYKIGPILNQGSLGACVAYSLVNLFAAEPISQRPYDPVDLYNDIRKNKGYKGEDGLRLTDAVDYVAKKGKIKEDLWTQKAENLSLYIFNTSPCVLSVPWYGKMDEPAKDGRIRPSGGLLGFHAVMAYSYDKLKERIWLQNQYGKSWGQNGCCYITLDDMEKLFKNGGLGCALVE